MSAHSDALAFLARAMAGEVIVNTGHVTLSAQRMLDHAALVGDLGRWRGQPVPGGLYRTYWALPRLAPPHAHVGKRRNAGATP